LGKLPPEYAAIGLRPRPWTPEDVIATWFVAEQQYGSFGGDEVGNAALLAAWTAALGAGTAAKGFADTPWLDDPSAPTPIPRTPPGPDAQAGATGPAVPPAPGGVRRRH